MAHSSSAPYRPQEVSYSNGNHTQDGIIRRGGLTGSAIRIYHEILARKKEENFDRKSIHEGITLGRNAYSAGDNKGTTFHELFHIKDIEAMGWAEFHGRWFYEMLNHGFNGAYNTENTLENNATQAEINYMKNLR